MLIHLRRFTCFGLLVAACSESSPPPPAADAGGSTPDAARPDAAPSQTVRDAAVPSATLGDASPSAPDASGANPPDAGNTDAAAPDAASNDGGQPPDAAPPPLADYFPLADGVVWTFRHNNPNKGTWDEISTVHAIEWEGEPAWQVVGSPDADGNVEIQTWLQRGTATTRVQSELYFEEDLLETTEYDPGFTRFNSEWLDASYDAVVSYTRTVTDELGMTTEDTRSHRFRTLDTDATVVIDAVTYEHCLQVERYRDDNMETKLFWFAPGVGKIKEVDPDSLSTEELVGVAEAD